MKKSSVAKMLSKYAEVKFKNDDPKDEIYIILNGVEYRTLSSHYGNDEAYALVADPGGSDSLSDYFTSTFYHTIKDMRDRIERDIAKFNERAA